MAPGSGARHSPATPPRSSGSSSARRAKVDWPSGPLTSAPCVGEPHPVAPSQPVLGHQVDHPVPSRAPCPTRPTRRRRSTCAGSPGTAARTSIVPSASVSWSAWRGRPTLRQPACRHRDQAAGRPLGGERGGRGDGVPAPRVVGQPVRHAGRDGAPGSGRPPHRPRRPRRRAPPPAAARLVSRPSSSSAPQRQGQPPDGGSPVLAVRHELGHQRVVGGAHDAAGLDGAVGAQSRPLGPAHVADRARRGPVVLPGPLGAQAHLHGVPVRRHRGLAEREGQPGGHRQLQAHEVEPGHQLGHAVLDLQPRVHLEEVEARRHRPGTRPCPRPRSRRPGPPPRRPPTSRGGPSRARGRPGPPPPPSGAAAAPSTPGRTGAARCRGCPRSPAPRRGGGPPGSAPRRPRRSRRRPRPPAAPRRRRRPARSGSRTSRMPRPPPPADALTRSGYPTAAAASAERCLVGPCRHHGARAAPAHRRRPPAPWPRALWPMTRIAVGRRADPDDARRLARLGQRGVLGQEPVARVQGVGPRHPGGPHQRAAVEIRLARATPRAAARRRRPHRRGGCRRRPRA